MPVAIPYTKGWYKHRRAARCVCGMCVCVCVCVCVCAWACTCACMHVGERPGLGVARHGGRVGRARACFTGGQCLAQQQRGEARLRHGCVRPRHLPRKQCMGSIVVCQECVHACRHTWFQARSRRAALLGCTLRRGRSDARQAHPPPNLKTRQNITKPPRLAAGQSPR